MRRVLHTGKNPPRKEAACLIAPRPGLIAPRTFFLEDILLAKNVAMDGGLGGPLPRYPSDVGDPPVASHESHDSGTR